MIQLNLENNGNNVVHLSAQREVTKQVGNPTTKIEPKLQDLNFWNYIMSNIRTTPCKYTTLIALINVRGQICFEIFVSFYCWQLTLNVVRTKIELFWLFIFLLCWMR